MKNLNHISKIVLLFVLITSCKKEENTTVVIPVIPITNAPLGCRLDNQINGKYRRFQNKINAQNLKLTYSFNKDGQVIGLSFVNIDNPNFNFFTKFNYENGLLTNEVNEKNELHKYEYDNGIITKITLLKTSDPEFLNYIIDISTDSKKRIIKLVDSKGFQTDILRDILGNIIEIKTIKIADKTTIFQEKYSDFDGKKSEFELFKGFQFDFSVDYNNYMLYGALVHNGESGNPRKIVGLVSETELKYEYNSTGYPIKIEEIDIKTGNIISKITNNYLDCK